MKKLSVVFLLLCLTGSLFFPACKKDLPDTPPIAGFQFSPITQIIADETYVEFNNTTSGTATAWQWDFGTNESGSTSQNPNYRFDFAGAKTITLTASGPLGGSVATKSLTVHAMDPNCHNYTGGATQSDAAIQSIRDGNQQKVGLPYFWNDYSAKVRVEFFNPDDWLNGNYTPYGNYTWAVNGSFTGNLILTNGQPFNLGNDWGVRITLTDGTVSCIRTVKDVSIFENGELIMTASRVFEGI